jgi:hypothetical protein
VGFLKKIKEILLSILLFLFIFNIPFRFMPFGTSKLFVLSSLILLLVLILKERKIFFINHTNIIIIFVLIVFLIMYSLIMVGIVKKTFDFFPIYIYILFLVEHILGSFIILFFLSISNMLNIDDFINIYINMAFFQAIISISMFLIPKFRNFIFSIADTKGEILFEMYNGIRGFGLAFNLTYDFAVIQSLALIFLVYIIMNKNIKKIYWFKLIIISFSIILSARTGFIGIFFSFILFLIFMMKNKIKFKKGIKIIFISLVVLILLSFTLFYSLNNNMQSKIKNEIIPFAFEMFISLYENNTFETGSTNVLFEKMYFKIDFNTFFFGDGYYLDPDGDNFYMNTDAGYMTQILYYGIFGSLILYSIFIFIFYNVDKKLKENYKFQLRAIYIFIGIYYFVVQIKGDFLLNGMAVKFIFLTLLILLNENKKVRITF